MQSQRLISVTGMVLAVASNAVAADGNAVSASPKPFRLEALVDFVDDALGTPFTPAHVDAMMAALAGMGVSRVSWAYYGDGHGGYLVPAGLDERWSNLARSYESLGNPLRVAAEAAHRHGMELYAYYKPYETGPAVALPEGSPEGKAYGRIRQRGAWLTWFDPFVVDNPQLRIRRRREETPGHPPEHVPICGLRLTKKDDSPTRVTAEHLQIWSSRLNFRYQPCDVPFELREEVVPSRRDVRDIGGTLLTREGAPVRTLTLTGFELRDPYVLVTTDFSDGPADFENAGTDILTALDAEGREIPGVFFSGAMIYMRERIHFRDWGLVFDCGYGRSRARLDEANTAGNKGVVAFARGRNEYLPGALCETEPAVREFWLECIAEMIEAGVDGVDFRVENHGTHTEYPEEYGFNEVVLEECARRGKTDRATVAAVRGDAYTSFLRCAREALAAHGRRMRVNLNLDWFRPDRPANRRLAYPANIDFAWRQWVDERLFDEGVLRMYALPFDAVFTDDVAAEMISRCQAKGIPLTVNRYIHPTSADEFDRTRRDGRFSGFILYETASYLRFGPGPSCSVTHEVVKEIARRLAALRSQASQAQPTGGTTPTATSPDAGRR